MTSAATGMTVLERDLLEAARRGDEGAYRRLVEPRHAELLAHCYRMLGSVHDAEDALQDALLRAWRGIARFEGRSSPRSWLYRIATNTCLDLIARRPKRVLPLDHSPAADPHDAPGPPLLESIWIEPYPDEALGLPSGSAAPDARYEQREAVELAFVAALQHLPALQRAVLICREVLGFSAQEVADVLETTVPAVNSALQRARKAVGERLPERSQQATLRALGDERVRALVEKYMAAWERGDVDGIVALLAEDAVVTMPPMPTWYRGRDAARTFLSEWAFARRWEKTRFVAGERHVRLVPVRAGGQLAFAAYNRDGESGVLRPYALQVLTLRGDRVAEIDGFVMPDVFAGFRLPAALPA